MVAPALSTVRSRSAPGPPSSTRRATPAFFSGVPAATASRGALASPTDSGVTRWASSRPSRSSTTRVGPETLSSSSPSSLDTTSACSHPSSPRAPATMSRKRPSETPISCRVAPAGLVRGPRKLKIVRTASSFRTPATCFIAGWWLGANMNPNPTSSMQRATSRGPRSMRAPSASSTSADPDRPVAERLPCFATLQPAPAATNAAVVDTLKVGRPPPVPAVSTRGDRGRCAAGTSFPRAPELSPFTSTLTASSRIARAIPAISATVSPFVRNAIKRPAVCASEALPSITSRSTAVASSEVSASLRQSRSMASVRIGLGIRARGSCATSACRRP